MNISSFKILIIKAYKQAYPGITSLIDYPLLKLGIPLRLFGRRQSNPGPKIVFVFDNILARIPRTAKWIRREGSFSTVLIASRTGYLLKLSNDEWDDVLLFRNRFHLLRILRYMKNVYLYHAGAPKSYYADIVRTHVKEPFIIDFQDVLSGYYGLNPSARWIRQELPHEKACLLQADGIVAHSLEPNVALRHYNPVSRPPTLFFPLYCDNDQFKSDTKIMAKGDIHIVYAGGVAGSHRDKAHYGSIQFHDLIREMEAQQIHFHIYPSPTNLRADYEEYEQISRNSKYFHFHESVPLEVMGAELGKYHFGILPFFSAHSSQSAEKYKYATSLKLFNYIEAGLPVLVSGDLYYQSWIVRRYQAGIVLENSDIAGLREMIAGVDYPSLMTGLLRNREEISLKVQLPRLLRFYREVKERHDTTH